MSVAGQTDLSFGSVSCDCDVLFRVRDALATGVVANFTSTFSGSVAVVDIYTDTSSGQVGTHSNHPLLLYANFGNEGLRITNTTHSSVVVSDAAIATNATDGFLYIPTCAGTPTGTPTTYTGRIPMVYDTTNHQFWFYDSGWKQPKTPAGASTVTWQ
jgi:hypothetical protein